MTVLLICSSLTVIAQSNGDKLFLEGQRYQRTMTVASQNTAISKFAAAKIVYTSSDKKTMCDNQISICRSNIKNINNGNGSGDVKKKTKHKTSKQDKKSKKEEEVPVEQEKPKIKVRTDVSLKLSESRLDFKYKPKEGSTQSVDVICNYDDWVVASKPDWVTVYTAKNKISVEVQENESDEERSGIVTIKCDNTECPLVINQDKKKVLDKIMGSVFKKKKKK